MARQSSTASLESTLGKLADRLGKTRSMRDGAVIFHLTGPGGGEFSLDCSAGRARAAKGKSARPVLLEIHGDAARIRAILDGRKDAVTQFLAGGIRVRGDLPYFSKLAVELGLLKQPL